MPETLKIVLGSTNAAKIAAVRAAAQRIAVVSNAWHNCEIIPQTVVVSVPAMPLSDEQLRRGACERAENALQILQAQGLAANYAIGLEGGFHSFPESGRWQTFLRGWAYVTDGTRGYFGSAPAITVPDALARRVIEGGRELSAVIDEATGATDVRQREGAWGVLSRNLLTRSESFEAALIAACAPFYNSQFYAL